MKLVDQHGARVSLKKKIGTGGEGTVYEVNGSADLVAKIYHATPSSEKADKLEAMVRAASPEIAMFAAWPKATLHAKGNGRIVGALLPRIQNANEIHELYSPAQRKLKYPRADWRFLFRTARNCAAAFDSLHRQGIVIGDVNQGNLFVSDQAMVSLIDCDSFQLTVDGRLYPCTVGVAHFIPPELQNARLHDVVRTHNHDNFGLALIIFHLLLMGRHPFSGRYTGSGEMTIERAIREHRFAYGTSATGRQMKPPPHTLRLPHLPQSMSDLFEQAFSSESCQADTRPSAKLWADTLERCESQLVECKHDSGHKYAVHMASCPWCEISAKGGPNFFISVTLQAVVSRSAKFSFSQIWGQITAVKFPDFVRPEQGTAVSLQASPATGPTGFLSAGLFVAGTAGIVLAGAALGLRAGGFTMFSVPMLFVYGIWWMVLDSTAPARKNRKIRLNALALAENELRGSVSGRDDEIKRQRLEFQNRRAALDESRKKYERAGTNRDAKLVILKKDVRRKQLEHHLRRCFISQAQISGIGPGRSVTLASYGIETAYDVKERTIYAIEGFGDHLTGNLLEWRRLMERNFQFDSSRGVPQSEIKAVELRYARDIAPCVKHFECGPDELRAIVNVAERKVRRLDEMLAEKETQCAQARLDAKEFKRRSGWLRGIAGVLCLIAVAWAYDQNHQLRLFVADAVRSSHWRVGRRTTDTQSQARSEPRVPLERQEIRKDSLFPRETDFEQAATAPETPTVPEQDPPNEPPGALVSEAARPLAKANVPQPVTQRPVSSVVAGVGLVGLLHAEIPHGLATSDFQKLDPEWEEWRVQITHDISQLYLQTNLSFSAQIEIVRQMRKSLDPVIDRLAVTRKTNGDFVLLKLYNRVNRRVTVAEAILNCLSGHVGAQLSNERRQADVAVLSAIEKLERWLNSDINGGQPWLKYVRASEIRRIVSGKSSGVLALTVSESALLNSVYLKLTDQNRAENPEQLKFIRRPQFQTLAAALDVKVSNLSATALNDEDSEQLRIELAHLIDWLEEWEENRSETASAGILDALRRVSAVSPDCGAAVREAVLIYGID